jgi:hypothetical protein
MKLPDQSRRARLGLGFGGRMIIATGALVLVQGRLHYRNPWGLPVFAPFALIIGTLFIILAVRLRPYK